MPIQIICPACDDTVAVSDQDRGQSIKCGTCWTEIPVPAADTRATAAAPEPAKPLPAKAIPVSTTPVGPKPAMALPAPAVAVAAIPVAPATTRTKDTARKALDKDKDKPSDAESTRLDRKRRSSDTDESEADRPRPRKRSGRSFRDDDDDSDTSSPKKSGSGAILIIGGVIGVLMLGVVIAGVAIWYVVDRAAKSVSSNTTPNSSTDGRGDAGFTPNAGFTPSQPSNPHGFPSNWEEFRDTDGFTFWAPNMPTSTGPTVLTFNKLYAEGKWYQGRDLNQQIVAEVKFLDLPPGLKTDWQTIISQALAIPINPSEVGVERTLAGHPGRYYDINHVGRRSCVWVTQIGRRVYVFHFQYSAFTRDGDTLRDKFFDVLKVTHTSTDSDVEPVALLKAFDTRWIDIPNANGFKARGGPNGYNQKHVAEVDGKFYSGSWHNHADAGYDYQVFWHDFPENSPPNVRHLLPALIPFGRIEGEPTKAVVDGKDVMEWKVTGHGGAIMRVRTYLSGYRIYCFVAGRQFINREPEQELERRAKVFFDSIKITFDPKNPEFDPIAKLDWPTHAKPEGFSLRAPKGLRAEEITLGFARDSVKGMRYVADEESIHVQVSIFPVTPVWTSLKIVTTLIGRDKLVDGPSDSKLDGKIAEDRVLEDFFRNKVLLRTALLGNQVIAVRITQKPRQPERDIQEKTRLLLASIKLMAPGTTSPPNPMTPTPIPMPNVKGELVFAANIAPFWVGAALPAKGEFIAVGAREVPGRNRGGILKRYSYPDFKLKATYHLSLPVIRMIADEKAGRLYCAVATKETPGLPEREQLFHPGAVHVYDLKKITDGSLNELEDIKNTNVFGMEGVISGMEMSPDGSTLYVATQMPASTPAPTAALKGRVYRFDLDKQQPQGQLDHPEAISAMKLSADGKRLVVGEVHLTNRGAAPLPGGRQYNLHFIDAEGLKKSKSVVLPGPVVDLTFAEDDVLALVLEDGGTKLHLINEDGTTKLMETKLPPGKPLRYIRASRDGQKLLASVGAPAGDGAYLFEVNRIRSTTSLASLAGGDTHESRKIGGHFFLTPDAKFAVMQCGSVIDLARSAGK